MRLKGTYDKGPKFVSLIDGAKDVNGHYFPAWMYISHPWAVVDQSDETYKIALNDNDRTIREVRKTYCREWRK